MYMIVSILMGILLLPSGLLSQEKYSKVSIPVASREDAAKLGRLGISLEGCLTARGGEVTLFVSERELRLLTEHRISYSVLIPDWMAYYRGQQGSDLLTTVKNPAAGASSHFRLGSMGGALTMEELSAVLDSMHVLSPSIVSARDSIGRTHENRPIWAVRIGAGSSAETKPAVLYLATHHAREPASLMTAVYFMWYLLENYGTDPEVTSLVDNRELWFIPLVNPDGYCYNESLHPSGGGLWRKNRVPNFPDSSFGVDLNRNYGYNWAYDDFGSSPVTIDEAYRGRAPFSELETQAIRRFATDKHIVLANSLHAFAGYVFSPWNFNGGETSDSAFYGRLESGMTRWNKYTSGAGFLYTTNGEATDWLYGDTVSKPKVYALTTEVGAGSDGFWPSRPRMIEIAEENLQANLVLAHAAGEYLQIDKSGMIAQFTPDSMKLTLPIVNGGIGAPGYSVNLSVSSPDLDFATARVEGYQWQDAGPLTLAARARKPPASIVSIAIRLDYPGGTTLDTLAVRLGPFTTIYADDAEHTRDRWIAASTSSVPWDTTSLTAHSGRLSFAVSPEEQWEEHLESTLQLDSTLSVAGAYSELRFWLKGISEQWFDCLRIEVSTDQGGTWNALAGSLTRPASGLQAELPYGAPVIDGKIRDWVEESMDLTRFLGKPILLRFRFSSFSPVIAENFFVDDVRILTYGSTAEISGNAAALPSGYALGQNFPNPFNPSTRIRFSLPVTSFVSIVVYDLLGREVAVLVNDVRQPGEFEVDFTARGLASGVYVYRMRAGGFVQAKRLAVVR